jgi:RNA polymerase sigma factor FliA
VVSVLPTPAAGLEEAALRYARITFARVVRKRPRWHGIDLDDVWGAALLGAAKALERFDPARGAKFSSFAIRTIHGAMLEEMRRQDWLTRKERQRARAEEKETGVCPEWAAHPPSLHEPAGYSRDGEVLRLADLLPDPDADTEAAALERIEAEAVRRLVGWLPALERHVIRRSLWDGAPLTEIAGELDRSETRAQQLHQQARARLREWAREEGLVEEERG